MPRQIAGILVAETPSPYRFRERSELWAHVLVDCPDIPEPLTYRVPPDLDLQPGAIVLVPLKSQLVGGIVVRLTESLPAGLDRERVRSVTEAIAMEFFPETYWQLLERVAEYYCTSLVTVVRSALPPGLLGRSQQRIRLLTGSLPDRAVEMCRPVARQVLELLRASKAGDYSTRYLQRQVKGARRGWQELIDRGWAESYLEPPKAARPKQQKAVTLVGDAPDVSDRQREVLDVLRRRGGELWLTQLLQLCRTSSSVVEALVRKGCVVVQEQEVLRLSNDSQPQRDLPKTLTEAQAAALSAIASCSGYAKILLHGVTGSGKTEVYLQAIAPILARGHSALVLVPEIGLTPQLTDRFRARFGSRVRVYHSNLSDGERYDTWRQTLQGEPQVIIGTRSAVFAPLPRLGILILDEEHDASFKQSERSPTYHARTVAQWRSQLENCPLILGSATPSLVSWAGRDANEGMYLSLPQRVRDRPLPPITIVDMRQELQQGNRSIFSRPLAEALNRLHHSQQQGILFVPRRGHSTFVSCRSCGYVIECPNCDVSLSYHYTHEGAQQLLRCHYCNHTQLQPPKCPACGSPYLKHFGSGTQRVMLELERQFPQLRSLRFDSDTTRAKGAHRAILDRFANGEADLLVGTQMLTKGLDLAQVTLVGVVAADVLLNRSDYIAAERAFQTLAQVAGRAGRGDDPGRVIVQTYSPESPAIEALRSHDYVGFATAELEKRSRANYPPYCRLILLHLSGSELLDVQQTAEAIAEACEQLCGEECEVLGPAPATIMRVNRQFRWQVLLKFASHVTLDLDLATLRALCPSGVRLGIDVDPLEVG